MKRNSTDYGSIGNNRIEKYKLWKFQNNKFYYKKIGKVREANFWYIFDIIEEKQIRRK